MDVKRVVAYSTMVHVGLMLVGLGLVGIDARGFGSSDITDTGMEHLFVHGWSKGLLFMVVGVVLHSVIVQDMRGTGGMVASNGILGIGLVATWSVAGIGGSMIGISKECVLGTLVMEFGWIGSVIALLVVGSIGYSIGITMSIVGLGNNAWTTGGGLSIGVWALLAYLGVLVVVLPLGAGYSVGMGRESNIELLELLWCNVGTGAIYKIDWLTAIFVLSVLLSMYVGRSKGSIMGFNLVSDSIRALHWNRWHFDRLVNSFALWLHAKVLTRVVIDVEYGWGLNTWFSGWFALRLKSTNVSVSALGITRDVAMTGSRIGKGLASVSVNVIDLASGFVAIISSVLVVTTSTLVGTSGISGISGVVVKVLAGLGVSIRISDMDDMNDMQGLISLPDLVSITGMHVNISISLSDMDDMVVASALPSCYRLAGTCGVRLSCINDIAGINCINGIAVISNVVVINVSNCLSSDLQGILVGLGACRYGSGLGSGSAWYQCSSLMVVTARCIVGVRVMTVGYALVGMKLNACLSVINGAVMSVTIKVAVGEVTSSVSALMLMSDSDLPCAMDSHGVNVSVNVAGIGSVLSGSVREGLVSGIVVLLGLEGLLLGCYEGGITLVWLVVCMDSVSMLLCVWVYGKGVVVSRYLMLQGGLTCMLWLGLTSGISTLVGICWYMKLGVGFGAFVLPGLYGRLGAFGIITAGVVGMVQLWVGVSIGLHNDLWSPLVSIFVGISGLALVSWIINGLVANVGSWRSYSLSVSTVVLGVTTWLLGEGLAGGLVLTGLLVWVAMVLVTALRPSVSSGPYGSLSGVGVNPGVSGLCTSSTLSLPVHTHNNLRSTFGIPALSVGISVLTSMISCIAVIMQIWFMVAALLI